MGVCGNVCCVVVVVIHSVYLFKVQYPMYIEDRYEFSELYIYYQFYLLCTNKDYYYNKMHLQ